MPLPRPKLANAKPYSFPKKTLDKTLENGLRILAFDVAEQYIVSCQLVLPVPLAAETTDGIATLLLNVASGGTERHPGISFSEAIEDQGAGIATRTSHNATFIQLNVTSGRLKAALPLLAEIVTMPELAADELQRQQTLQIAQLEQLSSNPGYLASRFFNKAIFDENMRLSRPKLGDAAQVAQISLDELRQFHQLWSAQGATLVLAGELPEDLEEMVENSFGSWNSTASRKVLPEEVTARSAEPIIWLVDRPEAVQANVQIGGLGIGRNDQRWAALKVACLATGGSFGSRLNMLLREDLGYTYGARLSPSPVGDQGIFTFSSSFRTEIAADAIKQTMTAMQLTTALSDQEVADAKNYLLGISPMVFDTSSAIASEAAALVAAGLETDYLAHLDDEIGRITAELATQAYHDVILPSRCNIVVVGARQQLLPELTAAGFKAEVVDS